MADVTKLKRVNLRAVFAQISEYCKAKTVAELNGHEVRLARMNGAFIWHTHTDEDELLMVVDGHLVVETRHGNYELEAGELVVVPRGMEHRTVALGEVRLLMFEPATTCNTGNVVNHFTVLRPERSEG